jgi:hypothetical protein
MATHPVRLKLLLEQQHCQIYKTFRKEYDKAARLIDRELIGTAPSRAQFYRWLTGDLKGLPFPDHCRVLEKMFPGMTAQQLFELCPPDSPVLEESLPLQAELADLEKLVDAGLGDPRLGPQEWQAEEWAALGTLTEPIARPKAAGIPSPAEHVVNNGDGATGDIARKLAELRRVMRLSEEEVRKLAALAGNIVELEIRIEIDIAHDGWARLTYWHRVLNMGAKSLARIPRELWFEHTRGPLTILPLSDGDYRVAIERIHDTASLAKFACRVSPPIRTGEVATLGYTCEGGRFVSDHYWRQSFPRYTRHLTLRLRHRGARQLAICTAVEEHADGSENSATEDLMWDYEDEDVVITLTRDYLHSGQAVTLRWDVGNADS